jgi:hypothetical protein
MAAQGLAYLMDMTAIIWDLWDYVIAGAEG